MPKKGLGIAKLEKILREEKEREQNKMVVAEFSSRLLSTLPPQYQPPSWSTSFSVGRNHQIEFPSNQRPYADYSFIRPEEHKACALLLFSFGRF